MPLLGSITQPLIDFAVNVIEQLGLAGIFVLMVLESACIPVPSEATMLFAGFGVFEGRWDLWTVTLVGSVANLVGSWIAYAVGYYGRVDVLEKHGKKLHISPKQLERADRWFEKWGSWAVLVSRMLPIVRTFISLPAGVARMPFIRFSVLTFIGCVPWVFLLTFLGRETGRRWTDLQDKLHYVDYAVAAIIVGLVAYYGWKWWRGRAGGGTPAADAPS